MRKAKDIVILRGQNDMGLNGCPKTFYRIILGVRRRMG